MYVGAKLPLLKSTPSSSAIDRKQKDEPQQQQRQEGSSTSTLQGKSKRGDAMEGMPFKWLADYLGETLWPVLQQVKVEDRKRRIEAKKKNVPVVEPPPIPHLLPLTKWMAKSRTVRETLVVDEANRQRPRLSWYHPDDTMVPRNWFRGGLWADLKYYKPFVSKKK